MRLFGATKRTCFRFNGSQLLPVRTTLFTNREGEIGKWKLLHF